MKKFWSLGPGTLPALMLLIIAMLSCVLIPLSSAKWQIILEDAGIVQLSSSSPPARSGASLEASNSAHGYWERIDGIDTFGVRGQVCVKNSGEFPTENLSIQDIVQIKENGGPYNDYLLSSLDLRLKPTLAAGETFCFPFDVHIIPKPNVHYRNVARVSITNHSGWTPGTKNCPGLEFCSFGPESKSDFFLPEAPLEVGATRTAFLPSPTSTSTWLPTNTVVPPSPSPTQVDPEIPIQRGAPTPLAAETAPSFRPVLTPTLATPTALPSSPTPGPVTSRSGCVLPVAFWLDTSTVWPVDTVTAGGMVYSPEDAAGLLEVLLEDESSALALEIIVARLNVASRASVDPVKDLLERAERWLAAFPPRMQAGELVQEESAVLVDGIRAYNQGELGVKLCSSPTPTSTPTPSPTITILVETPPAERPVLPSSTSRPVDVTQLSPTQAPPSVRE